MGKRIFDLNLRGLATFPNFAIHNWNLHSLLYLFNKYLTPITSLAAH